MSDLPDGYYAVPDPDDDTEMTYWRLKNGVRYAWPVGASFGPARRARAGMPAKGSAGYREWIDAWLDRCGAWGKKVGLALAADAHTPRRRFAELTTRCLACARLLTDDKSKLLGIGPDCRAGLDEADLAVLLTPQIARAHAAELNSTSPDRSTP